MKINLKNRFSWWVLLHLNLVAAIVGLTTLLVAYWWSSELLTALLWAGLFWSASGLILDYLKDEHLYYLKKNEAFYLWLKKTKNGAELGEYFWREKNAQYYKIFFGNLPSVRIISLINKPVVFGFNGQNRIEYITCWVTLVCELKGPYSADDLYEKIIKAEDVEKIYDQHYWKINDAYYLRKYIVEKINQLLIKNPQLLAQWKKYKNNRDDQEFIKVLQRFLSEINPSEILQNCIKIRVLRIEPKITRTHIRLTPLKHFEKLYQQTKPRN